MKLFLAPKLFRDDVPKERRLQFLREYGARADAEFKSQFPALERWVTNYDPIYVLSFCAFYYMASPEGIDPEAFGELEFLHHYLEILQALALYKERNLDPRPLAADAAVLKKELRSLGAVMLARHFNFPAGLAEDEVEAHKLRTEMMIHTMVVRNWAYPHQVRRVVRDLCRRITAEFEAIFDINPLSIVDLIFKLAEERNDLLNVHRDKLRSMLEKKTPREITEAYNAAFPDNVPIDSAETSQLWELAGRKSRNLASMLIMHADLRLDAIYSFDIDHAHSLVTDGTTIVSLKAMFDRLSYSFGELSEFPREHIILSNPVHGRPFIRLDDRTYYSAIWGIVPHVILDLIEDLVWPHEKLRQRYVSAKASYLEDEIERLVREAFPSAAVFRGSLWKDTDSGKEYENDLLVTVDNFALVVEGKSGSVTDPARRGAPERLYRTLRELIEQPSQQALRFIDFLRTHKQIHRFQTRSGGENVVDSTALKHYIPLGVTLSHLGSIGSNLKKLIEAQVVDKELEDLAPSINLTDLECVFELLPSEIAKVHYLARRREFEAHMEYEADELDLLAFYLGTGFNIGETEYDKSTVLNLGLKSKELDVYFVGSREGKAIEKPRLAMTEWWKDILARIEARKLEGWVETGFILLNSTEDDQEAFQRSLQILLGQIENGTTAKPHNWVMFLSGPERRRYAIAGYPYTNADVSLRNSVMSQIVESAEATTTRGAVVIGINLRDPSYPYSVLARRAETNLFDTLTL